MNYLFKKTILKLQNYVIRSLSICYLLNNSSRTRKQGSNFNLFCKSGYNWPPQLTRLWLLALTLACYLFYYSGYNWSPQVLEDHDLIIMFSSKSYLEKKTGPYGIGRLSYLQSLVVEYQDTTDLEAKHQVLANLANFAYDPINYEHIRKLNILDLFLDALEESDEKLVEFAIGGLCNAALDKKNKEYILQNGGVQLVIKCFSSPVEETVLSAITTLIYLVTVESKAEITSLPVVECMLRFSQSKNKRLSNLAQDYCTKGQVEEARKIQNTMMAHVPTS